MLSQFSRDVLDPQRYLLPVKAYLCTEELMQKMIGLGGYFLERSLFSITKPSQNPLVAKQIPLCE